MNRKKLNAWIVSFRLRTLPLSASSVILGSFIAAFYGHFSLVIFILALLTTESLQILSNLANDYGDMKSGADSADRIGPERALQKGDITVREIERMIIVFGLCSALAGLTLVYYGTRDIPLMYTLLFLVIGAGAIAAAVKYTVGKKPYGYRALGDLFVFIFFGIVGTMGTFFLHTGRFEPVVLLPAVTAGMMSVAVLNLNNMRDMDTDVKTGKLTLACMLGRRGAAFYHLFLFITALASTLCYSFMVSSSLIQMIYLIVFIPLLLNVITVFRCTDPSLLDNELKKVSSAAIAYALLLGVCLNFFQG